MTTTLVNGYNVTGNHAKSGREYHVCNAVNRVLHVSDGIEPAMAIARGMRTGDVVQDKPKPVVEIPPEVKAVVAPVEKPEPEKQPTATRTTKPRGAR